MILTLDAQVDRQRLLGAILEHPEDDLPRLEFADWCEENGREHRAAYIRKQIEIFNLPKCKEGPVNAPPVSGMAIVVQCHCDRCERWVKLMEEIDYLCDLTKPLSDWIIDDGFPSKPNSRRFKVVVYFRRGVPYRIDAKLGAFKQSAGDFFLLYPIEEVRLVNKIPYSCVSGLGVRFFFYAGQGGDYFPACIPGWLAGYFSGPLFATSREEMEEALSGACVRYGRMKAEEKKKSKKKFR